MKCPRCGYSLGFTELDDEFVCEVCGAAYCLEYLGMYEEGGNERIDAGFEPIEWLKKYGAKK